MLSCKELAQQHAGDYIDGHLRGQLKWSVRLHLVLCGHCRRFIKQLKIVKVLLKNTSVYSDVDESEIKQQADKLQKFHIHQ